MAYPNSIEAIFAQFTDQFCATMTTVIQHQLKVVKQTHHTPYTEKHTDNQVKNQVQPKLDTGQRQLQICIADERWQKTKTDGPHYAGSALTTLQTQFSSSSYEDPGTQFSKLVQTTSVADYEVQFQFLATRIYGLSENFLMGCFINGLKDEIQCEVLTAQPYNLHHAIGLAKLYEETLLGAETTQLSPIQHHSVSIRDPKPIHTPTQITPTKPLDVAYCVFDEIPIRDKLSRNVLISGFSEDEDCLCFVTNQNHLMYSDDRSETMDIQIMAWNADDKIDNDQNNQELSMGIEMIQSVVVGKTSSTKSDLKEKNWKTSYLVPPEDFLESLQVENVQSLTISSTESAKRDDAKVFEEIHERNAITSSQLSKFNLAENALRTLVSEKEKASNWGFVIAANEGTIGDSTAKFKYKLQPHIIPSEVTDHSFMWLHKVKDNEEYSKTNGVLFVLAGTFLCDLGYNVHVGSGCIIKELEYHVVFHGGATISKSLGFSFDLGGIFYLTSLAEYKNAPKFLLVDKLVFKEQENDAENKIRDEVNFDANMETRAIGCEGLKVLSSWNMNNFPHLLVFSICFNDHTSCDGAFYMSNVEDNFLRKKLILIFTKTIEGIRNSFYERKYWAGLELLVILVQKELVSHTSVERFKISFGAGMFPSMFSSALRKFVDTNSELTKELMPGSVNFPVCAFKSVGGQLIVIDSVKGSHIGDIDWNEYIDYFGSWGPAIIGHAGDEVLKALDDTMKKGTSVGAPCLLENVLVEMVISVVPSIEMAMSFGAQVLAKTPVEIAKNNKDIDLSRYMVVLGIFDFSTHGVYTLNVPVCWVDRNCKFLNFAQKFLCWCRDRIKEFDGTIKQLIGLALSELINGLQACLFKTEKQEFNDMPRVKLFKKIVNFQLRKEYGENRLIMQRYIDETFYFHELLFPQFFYGYNFKGKNDLVNFDKWVTHSTLYAHDLRMNFYVYAEWNHRGFSPWLHFIHGVQFRTEMKSLIPTVNDKMSPRDSSQKLREQALFGSMYDSVDTMLYLGILNIDCDMVVCDDLLNPLRFVNSVVDGFVLGYWSDKVEAHAPP